LSNSEHILKNQSKNKWIEQEMYENHLKRIFDVAIASLAFLFFLPLILFLIAITALIFWGNPFFFQIRPGEKNEDGNEKLFKIIKLRTMTNKRDENHDFLPDYMRLTPFGKWMRSTSLDEILEIINVIKGDMAIIGPRPQLVSDMVFMTSNQRRRHDVRPGLSGLAQINGRNKITWEEKLSTDLEYLKKISFCGDLIIIFKTIAKVLKREGINDNAMETGENLGDYLLRTGQITKSTYDEKMAEARKLTEKATIR